MNFKTVFGPSGFGGLLSLGVFILLTSCSGSRESRKHLNQNMDHLIQSAIFVQYADEYKALCFQAYNLGRMKLAEDAKNYNDPGLRCVIVDIDETVLDNSPYAGFQIKDRQTYTQTTWKNWTDLAVADTVPGALGFLNYAQNIGYEVFYVSNRNINEREATMENLISFGFPQVDTSHVLLRTDVSSKEPRRQKIVTNYRIALLAGDALGDFDVDFETKDPLERTQQTISKSSEFGHRYLVLPNPVYGAWALIPQPKDRKLTKKQLFKHRKSLINSIP